MTVRRELFAGEVLYQQGEASDCAWLLERGQVELVSVQGRSTARHGVFGPGELIGELGSDGPVIRSPQNAPTRCSCSISSLP